MDELDPVFQKAFFYNNDTAAAAQELLPLIKQFHPKELIPENVYQEGSPQVRAVFNKLLKSFILPKSRIVHPERLKELYNLSQAGKACLILPEHYGNFDFCNICYLTDNEACLGPSFTNSLVAVAGAKLSLDNAFIAAFVQIYNRVVIYPSRGLEAIQDEKEREEMHKKTLPINLASVKEMMRRRHNKQMFVVFPSGTRIRPWIESTKTGVPEIYNYLRLFDYVCLMSVNGNNLEISRNAATMTEDIPAPANVLLGIGPVTKTVDLIQECSQNMPTDTNVKAYVVNRMMQKLFALHEETKQLEGF